MLAVGASLYFLDSSVSVYRDAANNLVFDDAFNSPKTLSQLGLGGGDVTKAYVDASLNARDVSIAWLVANPGGGGASQTYVDGSLNARDVSIAWLAANSAGVSKAYVDASLNVRDIMMIAYAIAL